ncbi:MAG: NADH-quinone oxidoreductase subunit C [Candidatus Hydrogenedentota bacterium]
MDDALTRHEARPGRAGLDAAVREYARDLAGRLGADSYDRGIIVAPELLTDTVRRLRAEENFDYLRDITAVDWLGRRNVHGTTTKRFDLCYQFTGARAKASLTLKTHVDPGESIESLVPLFPSAEFLEREVFDLFGIVFRNHPDLRRILLSDDWEGHPLRKDYPVSGYDMWDWRAHR